MTTIHTCHLSFICTHQAVWTWEQKLPDDWDSTVLDVEFYFGSQMYYHFVSDIFLFQVDSIPQYLTIETQLFCDNGLCKPIDK